MAGVDHHAAEPASVVQPARRHRHRRGCLPAPLPRLRHRRSPSLRPDGSATFESEIIRRFGFLYPRRGYGQLSKALAQAAAEGGTELRLSTHVLG